MMNYFRLGVLAWALGATVAGCSAPQVEQSTSITLEQALTSVGTGLAGLRAAARDQPGAGGLIPQTVTITFNVGASATDAGSLTLQAQGNLPVTTAPSASINANASTSLTANRSNQVTVTLTNLLFMPSTGVLGDDPATLQSLLSTLKDNGYEIYVMDESKTDPEAKAQVRTLLRASGSRLSRILSKQETGK